MYRPFASMTACTRSGIDLELHRASGYLEEPPSTERKNFCQLFFHLRKNTRVVANPEVLNVGLSEKNSGVLNWIEVRGVRGIGLEIDGILFKGEHKLCSVC